MEEDGGVVGFQSEGTHILHGKAGGGLREVVFVIQSQRNSFHVQRAERLRTDLLLQAEALGELEHPHTVPADGAVGVEVEGHQAFWTCDNKPFILVLTTVPPPTGSLGVSTKIKTGLNIDQALAVWAASRCKHRHRQSKFPPGESARYPARAPLILQGCTDTVDASKSYFIPALQLDRSGVVPDCHGVTQNGSGSSSVTSPALVLVETPSESVCGGTVVSTEMDGCHMPRRSGVTPPAPLISD
ncbi:hypothetical protein NFI96_000028 [Prochilodus magdalenae]|nr:hypothetical protein NFI96_000028 [Prochilodus magdalenae]